MHKGLPVTRIAWKQIAFELFPVYAIDLVGDWNHAAILVINSSDAKDRCRNRTPLRSDYLFGFNLGLRVLPSRFDFRRLCDWFARHGRFHDEMAAGKDELLAL